MVESSLGRRWSLAGSTFVTAAFCIGFVFAETSFAVRTSTIGISLSSTVCPNCSCQICCSADNLFVDYVGCFIRVSTIYAMRPLKLTWFQLDAGHIYNIWYVGTISRYSIDICSINSCDVIVRGTACGTASALSRM